MPTLRERPLTWLFWSATLCAASVGLLKDTEATWFSILLYGQLYVICGWAAVSTANRLARGALLVIAPMLIALVVHGTRRSPDEGPAVLALGLIIGAIMFGVTRLFSILLRAAPGQPPRDSKRRWQVSVVELLGWMIVTAFGSWAVTMSKLPPLEHFHGFWTALASPIPAALIMAGFLAPARRHDRSSLLINVAVLSAFLFAAHQWDNQDSSDLLIYSAVFGYVAFWTLVTRLDEAAAGAGVVTLKLVADDDEDAASSKSQSARRDRRAVRFDEL